MFVGLYFKLFFTLPGTRIIYDRKFLLDRRNSPMAQTPPCHLPNIPGVTSPGTLIEDSKVEVNNLNNLNNHDRKHAVGKGMLVLGTKRWLWAFETHFAVYGKITDTLHITDV